MFLLAIFPICHPTSKVKALKEHIAAPKIWNSLHPSLDTCTSPDAFHRHLKTNYCQQAF